MKKILGTAILFALSVFMFAGCGLVTKDNEKFLNEVVATVGSEKITREDYIEEYNSVYYSYYNAYGENLSLYTIGDEKLVDTFPQIALDNLVNRKILYLESKKKFGDLTSDEMNYIWNEIFDSLDENLKTYAEKYVASKQDDSDDEEDTATSTDDKQIEEYEKLAKLNLENGVYSIEKLSAENLASKISEAEKQIYVSTNTTLDYIVKYFADYKYDANDDGDFEDDLDKEAAADAKKEYVASLRKAENGREFEDKSKEAILTRKIDKLLTRQIQGLYVQKIQADMDENQTITSTDILNAYKDLVSVNYQKYSLSATEYNTAMQDNAKQKDVFYFANGEGAESYCKVSHLLLEFENLSDKTTYGDYITAYQSEFNAAYNRGEDVTALQNGFKIKLDDETAKLIEDDYSETINILSQFTYGTQNTLEVKDAKFITAGELLTLINSEMNKKTTLTEKYVVFADFMNKFSGDTAGIMDSSKTNNIYTYYDDISFVPEFKTAVSAMRDSDAPNGTLSGLKTGAREDSTNNTKSVYGFHIIIYLGECENKYNDIAEYSKTENANEVLKFVNENYYAPMSGETLFDYLYEKCQNNTSSNNETKLINKIREGYSIKIDENAKNKTFE